MMPPLTQINKLMDYRNAQLLLSHDYLKYFQTIYKEDLTILFLCSEIFNLGMQWNFRLQQGRKQITYYLQNNNYFKSGVLNINLIGGVFQDFSVIKNYFSFSLSNQIVLCSSKILC